MNKIKPVKKTSLIGRIQSVAMRVKGVQNPPIKKKKPINFLKFLKTPPKNFFPK
jgi:hypothetical protein